MNCLGLNMLRFVSCSFHTLNWRECNTEKCDGYCDDPDDNECFTHALCTLLLSLRHRYSTVVSCCSTGLFKFIEKCDGCCDDPDDDECFTHALCTLLLFPWLLYSTVVSCCDDEVVGGPFNFISDLHFEILTTKTPQKGTATDTENCDGCCDDPDGNECFTHAL